VSGDNNARPFAPAIVNGTEEAAIDGKFLWGRMTWPEIRAAAKGDRVVLLPVGVIEDHGPHLPLDTDVVLAEGVCRAAAERMTDRVLVAPTVIHGYSPHHMDFPGTITVRGSVFVDYVVDICKSIAYHGFNRILIVNGHGGNVSGLDMAAKAATLSTRSFVAMISHWDLEPVKRMGPTLLESPPAGGMVHADEFETSLYLALSPEDVQMERAVREIGMPPSRYFWVDLISAGDRVTSAGFMERWSAYTESSVIGDPTLASVEKGKQLLDAAAEGLLELVDEIRRRPIGEGRDHHGDGHRELEIEPW
jgi:creatinine amidohydrolase